MARFSGRCLLIAGFLYVVGQVVRSLPLVFLSLFVALLLTTLLAPVADWLARHRVPRSLAAGGTVLVGVAAVGGLLAFIIPRTVSGILAHADTLAQRARNLMRSLDRFLPGQQLTLDELGGRAEGWVHEHSQTLLSGAASGLSLLTVVLSGVLLALVLTFFFVRDWGSMLRSSLSLLPPPRRQRVHAAAEEAWRTLSQWVRGTVLVALIDAAGVGIGLVVLGVPLALPLALLTFLAAFVPIIGAVVAGAVAVLVAWAMVGLKAALITLAIVLAVQQLEGNVLQPVIMGRVLPLHPAVVILAVTAGTLLAGVAGALVAVPLLSAVTAGTRAFLAGERGPRENDERDEERPEAPEPPADSDEARPPTH